jgi:transposase InsO family protein
MSLRRLIVEVDSAGLNVRRFCAEHGISTWFFYELRRRHAAGESIEPRSRAAHRVANRTDGGVEDQIVGIRKELVEAGLDAGPATIRFHLERRGHPTPSEATIWRVLHRRGFVTADPSKAPKRAPKRFQAQRANEVWQTDDTTWVLADGLEVKIINVLDDCTRVVPASRVAPNATASAIFDAFCHGATEFGWPERVLCDNAKAHRFGLTAALGELSIAVGHSRPYHPQTCGKVERFHQTQKRWLAAQEPAKTLDALQAQLDQFRDVYNHHRPHRGIGRRIPAEVWAVTPKSGPGTIALTTPTRIHRVRADQQGSVWAGRRYSIALGARHAHATATIAITGLACHVFVDEHLARRLTLDPSRRHQPLPKECERSPATPERDAPRQHTHTMCARPSHARAGGQSAEVAGEGGDVGEGSLA